MGINIKYNNWCLRSFPFSVVMLFSLALSVQFPRFFPRRSLTVWIPTEHGGCDIVYEFLYGTDFFWFTENPGVTDTSHCFSQKLFPAFAKADETEVRLFQFRSSPCDLF